ncbi:MAG TPA: putative sulfate exporter family transporter [Desulfobacteraceae bacterium]|nr:putative sulfate exporter family transporter [Desulfobacteraceae bacterium]
MKKNETPGVVNSHKSHWSDLIRFEDYWAIWFGFVIIFGSLLQWIPKIPKVGDWTTNPLAAFMIVKEGLVTGNILLDLILLMVGLGVLTSIGIAFMKAESVSRYFIGFIGIFIISCFAYWISHQANIKYCGLSYAMWALLVGLLISNTVGTPRWLKSAAKTELFIKTGLVLLGAEILFKKILALGAPGLMVAWIVTPVVVIFMYRFGTSILKMVNKELVVIIASATSVCGVSAAIATAAACRAKKEDLTLAVGMTLIFTVLMMCLMPVFIKFIGMSPILGAAWMGGTIDSTGAVVAAGSMLGPTAEKVAAVVKMIQNVLIGFLAFFVALYWVTTVDRKPGGPKPNAMEIWYRFPKFVLGFVAASLLFSFIVVPAMRGDFNFVEASYIKPVTKVLRGWFFCLAFTSIGLESNFRDLASRMEGGKPLILYVVGQSFNLVLTLLVAFLAFMVFFPNAVQ